MTMMMRGLTSLEERRSQRPPTLAVQAGILLLLLPWARLRLSRPPLLVVSLSLAQFRCPSFLFGHLPEAAHLRLGRRILWLRAR